MSNKTHTVTVTTASVMPSLAFKGEAIKAPSGWLKVLQTVLGAAGFGIAATESISEGYAEGAAIRFQCIVMFTFLVTTFLLLASSLVSSMAANMIPKTIFEFLYHLTASISYLAVTVNFIVVSHTSSRYESSFSGEAVAISVIGFLNSILYFVSTYISFKSYRAS